MPSITPIITAYRRPNTIRPLVKALRAQTVKPDRIWACANDPTPAVAAALAGAGFDRIVTSSENTHFHARFALAMTAASEFVAVFDDDSIPGPNWFANCLETMAGTPGILGTAGIVLHGQGYGERTMHGWQRPNDVTVEVDLVGQAWFLRREWLPYLFLRPPVTGTNGEDIELAARAWRSAGIRSFCPPHPARDHSRWGSTRGLELGIDAVAASLRGNHEAERDLIVRAEMAAGWIPLFARGETHRNSDVNVAATASLPTKCSGKVSGGEYKNGDGQTSVDGPTEEVKTSPDQSFPVASAGTRQSAINQPLSPPLTLVYGAAGPVAEYGSNNDDRHSSIDETCAPARRALNLYLDGRSGTLPDLGPGAFDSIDLGDTLPIHQEPLAVLRRLREALAPGGTLKAKFANSRHQAVVGALLAGEWSPGDKKRDRLRETDSYRPNSEGSREIVERSFPHSEPGRLHCRSDTRLDIPEARVQDPKSPPLRIYTRREIEKLFFRSGYKTVELIPEASEELNDWRAAGSPGELRLGQMHIAGLSVADAEDFHTARYQVVAVPAQLTGRDLQRTAADDQGPLTSDQRSAGIASRSMTDAELISIVIPTFNQLAFTRQCLASIRLFTDEPYELIIVDNGSTDGTPQYVRSCPDVKLIANSENRGFPAACNQGALASRGTHILFLNNDVIVTTGWLTRMLRAFEAGRGDEVESREPEVRNLKTTPPSGEGSMRNGQAPTTNVRGKMTPGNVSAPHPTLRVPRFQVGVVGPCSNCVSGAQQVAAGYDDLACLDGWAWEHGKHNDGVREDVDRLVGFCLLVGREVFEAIGGFDERFGIGNFEDDDLCRRAISAGWRCVIARDAYIHHFGHASFAAAGVDLPALVAHNQRLYEEKWRGSVIGSSSSITGNGVSMQLTNDNQQLATDPRSADLVFRSTTDDRRPRLSCCMIARNNELTIGAAVASILRWADEVIVVDTGSTDRTPEICRQLGCRVYHFPWPNSFSIARNESLKYACGQWIIWIDSDDVIDAENGRKLRELVSGPIPDNILGFTMQVHCPAAGHDAKHDMTVVDHCKVFRNRPDLRFEGRIHEQVLAAIRRAGGEVVFTPLFVVHAGADHSPAGRRRKLTRDFQLLRMELKEQPGHTFTLFNLGMTFADAKKYKKAVRALERSLAAADPRESHVRKIYALLVSSLRELGRPEDATRYCREALAIFPKDAELHFRAALLHHDAGELRQAETAYMAALANDDQPHFASLDRGITGYKTRHNLAVVYTDMGALAKAEELWRRVVKEVPSYREGWQGLIDTLLEQKQLAEAADAVRRIPVDDTALLATAVVLAAKVAEAGGNLSAALEFLERGVANCPDEAAPMEALCRLLFYHGRPDETVRALEELVRRNPGNAAAYHNLGISALRMGHLDKAIGAFQTSLRVRPAAAHTQLSLGEALHARGRLTEAVRAFEASHRLAPHAPTGQAALRQLAEINKRGPILSFESVA